MVRPFARFNKHGVKPLGQRSEVGIGGNIVGRGADDAAALGRRDGFDRKGPRPAGLDLDKGDDSAPADDKVELAGRGSDPAI